MLILNALLPLAVSAQQVPTFIDSAVLSPETISQRCKALFTQDPDVADPATGSVTLVKVRYPSSDLRGRRVSLSGLLAIPTDGAPKGLIVYFHGTTTMAENVPSRYKGGSECPEAELAVMAFASAGYAVAAPDYLGLGDNPGRHPYPLASSNCLSGIDLIAAAQGFARGRTISLGSDLYVTGYSEGGAVAMWAAKKIQQTGTLKLTAAAPMAGPYDMTGAQTESLLSNQSNVVWLGARMYLMAYVGYSADTNIPGVDLNDLFAPSFASYVPHVFSQGSSDETVIKKIVQKGLQLGAFQSVRKVLNPKFVRALRTIDTSNPLVNRLKQENVYDWSPQCPLYMVCLKSDYVVDPKNTINAIRAMRARGLTAERVGYTVIENNRLTHITGIMNSIVLARRFFDSGFGAVELSPDPPPVKKS